MFCTTTLSFRTTSFFHQIKNFGMEIRYIYKHKCIFIYLFLTEIFTDDHNQAHTSYININKMILNYDGFWERHLLTWPVIPIQPMRALSIFWKTICEKISDYWPQKSQNCLLTWLKKKKKVIEMILHTALKKKALVLTRGDKVIYFFSLDSFKFLFSLAILLQVIFSEPNSHQSFNLSRALCNRT